MMVNTNFFAGSVAINVFILLILRIVSNLPIPSQHLLVLLFGTFRVITDSADTFGTRMTPEAIGISVAPSLFHTCIHDGQRV
jgi:Rho GTPase-activating protein 20